LRAPHDEVGSAVRELRLRIHFDAFVCVRFACV
jgi:hypothetical protein